MLSVDQARNLVAMYRRALAERGVETTPSQDGGLIAPDLTFGLHNLAVEVSHQPWSRWASVIDQQADALLDQAVANLRAQPMPERHDISPLPGETDTIVHALLSNDRYGAARLLLIDELGAQLLGSERPRHGRFLAVPNQHSLLVHEPKGRGVRAAIGLMMRIAQDRFRDGSGPISPTRHPTTRCSISAGDPARNCH